MWLVYFSFRFRGTVSVGYTKFHAGSGIVLGSLPNILHHSEKPFHTLVICQLLGDRPLPVAGRVDSHAAVSSSAVTLGHVVYLDGYHIPGKHDTLRDAILINLNSAYAEGYAS